MFNRRIRQLLSIPYALLVLVGSCVGAGYKGIYIGERVADLPKELYCDSDPCEGFYKGDWVSISELYNKVLSIDVIYVGTSLYKDTVISKSVPLARAIHIHSLQPGCAAPVLGLAKAQDQDHHPEGVVDIANRILYLMSGTPTDPVGSVVSVGYLGPNAPVLKTPPLPESQSSPLLAAARRATTDEAEFETRVSDKVGRIVNLANHLIPKAKDLTAHYVDAQDWEKLEPNNPYGAATRKGIKDLQPEYTKMLDSFEKFTKDPDLHRANVVEGNRVLSAVEKVNEVASECLKQEESYYVLVGRSNETTEALTLNERADRMESYANHIIPTAKVLTARFVDAQRWAEIDPNHPDAVAIRKEITELEPKYLEMMDGVMKFVKDNEPYMKKVGRGHPAEANRIIAALHEINVVAAECEKQSARYHALPN